jgi:mRNA interferase MazF
MITSAENRPWVGDLPLGGDQEAAGLAALSVVRPCKIAIVEARDVEPLGRIGPKLMADVGAALRGIIGGPNR